MLLYPSLYRKDKCTPIKKKLSQAITIFIFTYNYCKGLSVLKPDHRGKRRGTKMRSEHKTRDKTKGEEDNRKKGGDHLKTERNAIIKRLSVAIRSIEGIRKQFCG